MAARPAKDAPRVTVSAVVATYGRAVLLRRSLPALLADRALDELVVVVDGSEDGSMPYVEALRRSDPRVVGVWSDGVGAPAARERGVRAATGEVVLLVDDDVVAGADLAAGHARHHTRGRGLVVLGSMPVERPGTRAPGQAPVHLYAEEYDRMCERYEREPGRVLEDLWMGNVSLRREDALRVGLYSQAFGPVFHEDRDLGLRLRAAGLSAVFDRRLAARHLYERPLPAFVRGASSQGEGIVALHAGHADTLGPVDLSRFSAGLPAAARAAVRLAARPRADRMLRRLLTGLAVLAGRARLWPVETAAVRLLRRIAQQRGALSALAARRDGHTPSTPFGR